jgi:hypothetical protein
MSEIFKYDWGQEVCVTTTAPASMRPGQSGSVCGMREKGGSNIYIIEFSDGWSTEIPENFLSEEKD